MPSEVGKKRKGPETSDTIQIGTIQDGLTIVDINTNIINSREKAQTREKKFEADNILSIIINEFPSNDENLNKKAKFDDDDEKPEIQFIRQVNFKQKDITYSIQLKFWLFVQHEDDDDDNKDFELIIIVLHGSDPTQLCKFKYGIESELYTLDEMNLEKGEYFESLFLDTGIKISTVVLSLFSHFGLILNPDADNIELIDKAHFIVNGVIFPMSSLTYLTKGVSYYSQFNFKTFHKKLNDNPNLFETYINKTLSEFLNDEEVKRLYNANLNFVESKTDLEQFKELEIKVFFENMWTTLKKKAPKEKAEYNEIYKEFQQIITLVYEKILENLSLNKTEVNNSRSFSFGYLLF